MFRTQSIPTQSEFVRSQSASKFVPFQNFRDDQTIVDCRVRQVRNNKASE